MTYSVVKRIDSEAVAVRIPLPVSRVGLVAYAKQHQTVVVAKDESGMVIATAWPDGSSWAVDS